MDSQQDGLKALRDIRQMMERSSRFISLSGWSGVAAGCCALAGAFLARQRIKGYYRKEYGTAGDCTSCLATDLVYLALCVLAAALVLAFLFTWIRSRKEHIPIWGSSARRLMWNTLLPLSAGGIVALRFIQLDLYSLLAPVCLIFYAMALINGSKYTLGEVRYLGYTLLALGIVNLWLPHYGLYFWTIGFGVMHILYGLLMWWKYERNEPKKTE